MAKVLSFKIVGGEEVVAEVLNEKFSGTDKITSYTLKRPHILQFHQSGNGQVGLAFVPWTLSNPGIVSIEVPASAVILTFEPSLAVSDQYLQQVSGLSLATHI